MIRRLALAVAASAALLLGSQARADAPRGAGCGGDSDSSPACPPASLQCQRCETGSCIEALEQQGYTYECRTGSVEYWCDTKAASRASSGLTIPLAGFLVAASVWSTVRIGRRRPKQS